MTDLDTSIKALVDALEPTAAAYGGLSAIDPVHTVAFSQAISLKRIADALERLAAPITGLAPADTGPDFLRDLFSAPKAPIAENALPHVWQVWAGGECPVPAGTPIDVRFRDGVEIYGANAGEEKPGRPRDATDVYWDHDASYLDIVAWRLAK